MNSQSKGMDKQKKTTLIRWAALSSILINVGFNYYTNLNPLSGNTVGDISDKYPTLFTPAGYAFSIWGLIYLLFIVYGIVQILPSQKNKTIYDQFAWPLIITSWLSIAWIISFTLGRIGLSTVVISGMLITAILLFGWAKRATLDLEGIQLLPVPFGIYMGWLSVATIANYAIWLKSNWEGAITGETTWTMVMIIVAFVLSIIISKRFHDISFPMVVLWATIAIWVNRIDDNTMIAYTAAAMSFLLIIWLVIFSLWLWVKTKRSVIPYV